MGYILLNRQNTVYKYLEGYLFLDTSILSLLLFSFIKWHKKISASEFNLNPNLFQMMSPLLMYKLLGTGHSLMSPGCYVVPCSIIAALNNIQTPDIGVLLSQVSNYLLLTHQFIFYWGVKVMLALQCRPEASYRTWSRPSWDPILGQHPLRPGIQRTINSPVIPLCAHSWDQHRTALKNLWSCLNLPQTKTK